MLFRPLLFVLFLTSVGFVAADGGVAGPRTLTVTGEGLVSAAPDRATISVGVVSEGKTAAGAMAANAASMTGVFSALASQGIPRRAIQTSNFSLEPVYQEVKQGVSSVQRLSGYRTSNTVSVVVDDLGRVGALLDTLVTAGANQVASIEFSFQDSAALKTRAREAATQDALGQAQTYARAAGVPLGPIVTIEEPQPGRVTSFRPMAKLLAADEATPVSGGEQTVEASVTITWQIAD